MEEMHLRGVFKKGQGFFFFLLRYSLLESQGYHAVGSQGHMGHTCLGVSVDNQVEWHFSINPAQASDVSEIFSGAIYSQ